jgi:hypothetical protein
VFETTTVYREPAASEAAVTRREAVASETTVAHREPMASETAAAKAVTSSAKTTAVASATASTAPSERGCAGRRCRYTEHDGRSSCNHLLAHCSKLLMFHLIWIAAARVSCGSTSLAAVT